MEDDQRVEGFWGACVPPSLSLPSLSLFDWTNSARGVYDDWTRHRPRAEQVVHAGHGDVDPCHQRTRGREGKGGRAEEEKEEGGGAEEEAPLDMLLFCIVLPCSALFCLVLHCSALFRLARPCSALLDLVLPCSTLFCLVLPCSALLDLVLHGSAWHVAHTLLLVCLAGLCRLRWTT